MSNVKKSLQTMNVEKDSHNLRTSYTGANRSLERGTDIRQRILVEFRGREK